MASTALPPPPASAPGGGPPPASIMLAASAAAICRRRRQRNNNKCIIAFEAAGRRVLIDVPDRKGVEESGYTGELGGFSHLRIIHIHVHGDGVKRGPAPLAAFLRSRRAAKGAGGVHSLVLQRLPPCLPAAVQIDAGESQP